MLSGAFFRPCRHLLILSLRASSTSSSSSSSSSPPSPAPDPDADASHLRASVSSALSDRSLVGRRLEVSGWVRGVRRHRKTEFLDLSDGRDPRQDRLQVVLQNRERKKIRYHSSVTARGVLRPSGAPGQDVELEASSVQVLNLAAESGDGADLSKPFYPFAPRNTYPEEVSRRFPAYRAKLPSFAAALRVRDALSSGVRDRFRSKGFVHVHTPALTTNDCEGACEVFAVRPLKDAKPMSTAEEAAEGDKDEEEEESEADLYSSGKVFLTVSGQLHLEAVSNGLGAVYSFAPAFRVEGGRSRRHLTEFTMVEAEEAFVEDIGSVSSLAEDLIKSAVRSAMEEAPDSLGTYWGSSDADKERESLVRKMLDRDFVTLTYGEALSALEAKRETFQTAPCFGRALGREHELFLAEKYCDGVPVFVVDWPSSCKPFYARVRDGDPDTVSALDLLLPDVGEVAGGSLREHRADVLERSIRRCFNGSSPEECGLQWYVDLRRLGGSSPTGGFGLGFDRLAQFLLGARNIRDVVPFARTPYSCPL